MIGFVAFYFILWIVFAGMVCISFIFKIGMVYFYYFAAHLTCLRIPFYVIAFFEIFVLYHIRINIFNMSNVFG